VFQEGVVVTTLQTYGFDSYPYLHVSRRLRLPYARVLSVLREVEDNLLGDNARGLSNYDLEQIVAAYNGEMCRRTA